MSECSFDVALSIIKSNPSIDGIQVFVAQLPPLLDARAKLSNHELQIVAEALDLKSNKHLPFWDALLCQTFNQNTPATGILKGASFHNHPPKNSSWLSSKGISREIFIEHEKSLKANEILVLSSKVTLSDGSFKHIPQIDFHCPDTESNRKLAAEVLSTMGVHGYLLSSGKSFHFYGSELMDDREFIAFLGKSLLFSPITDRPWIAHQLIEGQSGLRISRRAGYGDRPSLILKLGA